MNTIINDVYTMRDGRVCIEAFDSSKLETWFFHNSIDFRKYHTSDCIKLFLSEKNYNIVKQFLELRI